MKIMNKKNQISSWNDINFTADNNSGMNLMIVPLQCHLGPQFFSPFFPNV